MKTLPMLLARLALCAVTALAITSCSTQMYTGQRAKKEQVARLKEEKGFLSPYFVTLWEVNGVRVHDTTFGIDVPPGKVRVAVLVHSPPTPSNPVGYRKVYRTITAKAGHVYTFSGGGGKLSIREEINKNFVDKMKKDER